MILFVPGKKVEMQLNSYLKRKNPRNDMFDLALPLNIRVLHYIL
jgi:hypothetical protein